MFVRIPRSFYRENFIRENANLTTGNLYFHPNPLLRWVFWERLRQIHRSVRKIKAGSVLDLGCGGGELLPTLSGLFPRVAGIDLKVANARRVAEHYRLKNVTLIEGDFLKSDFPAGGFDLVVAADVLEHQRDLEAFLLKLAKVLNPGGTVVVCLPVEGFFYRLGRKLFGLSAPQDNFQGYGELRAGLDRFFRAEKVSAAPHRFMPLFRIFKSSARISEQM